MIFEIGPPRKVMNHLEEAIEYINKYNGIKKAIFKSVYSFERMKDWRPDYDSAVIDRLFFDFDGDNCWEEANKLHQHLLEEKIKHYLVMSGNGYHVFIFTKPYNPKNSKSTIYNAQHNFIDKLNLKCDHQVVGDNARLHRVPNTWNHKAGRYCILLNKDQFKAGHEVIKILAREQNFIINFIIEGSKIEINSFDYKNEYQEDFKIEEEFTTNLEANYLKKCHALIRSLLSKDNIGWRDRYAIIMYFKEKGFTREEVANILKNHLSEQKYKHCVYEERQLQYLFTRNDLYFPKEYGLDLYK